MGKHGNSIHRPECGRLIISVTGAHLPLRGTEIRLGRSPRVCHLCVTGISVSRCHCVITDRDNHVFIEDLGSRNVTWINGVVIKKECLTDGAIVHLGEEQFVFEQSMRFRTATLTAGFSDFEQLQN